MCSLLFGAGHFPFKTSFEKCFKIVVFFALALRSGFRASISVARSFIMLLCNSVSAGHSGVAASMLLAGTAACLIRLSFAAGGRKSYWSAFAAVFPQSWR